MPTYFREGSVVIRLFNGDHNPPHVHIITPNGEMQVSLVTLEPLRGKIGRQEYQVALELIRSNIEFLQSEWVRLNG
jgi:hypothetical protein